MALKLGTYICENGKYQYRAIGPRPGTNTREHRVPGGRFATKEEALLHAQAFLSKTNPWDGHQYHKPPAKRKRAAIDPKCWHIDETLRGQVERFHRLVSVNVAIEDQVTTAEAKFAALDKKPLSENLCELGRSLFEARQAARQKRVKRYAVCFMLTASTEDQPQQHLCSLQMQLKTVNQNTSEDTRQLLRSLQSKLLPPGIQHDQPCKRATGKWCFDRTVQRQVDLLVELINGIADIAKEVRDADSQFAAWDDHNDSKNGKLSTFASVLFERKQGARFKQARLAAESRRWQKVNQDLFYNIETELTVR